MFATHPAQPHVHVFTVLEPCQTTDASFVPVVGRVVFVFPSTARPRRCVWGVEAIVRVVPGRVLSAVP